MEYVASNTEDKSKTWEERKQHTIDSIAENTVAENTLLLADKYDNICDLYINVLENGDSTFDSFKRGRKEQKWYFESVGKEIEKLFNHEKHKSKLLIKYLEIVEILFGE